MLLANLLCNKSEAYWFCFVCVSCKEFISYLKLMYFVSFTSHLLFNTCGHFLNNCFLMHNVWSAFKTNSLPFDSSNNMCVRATSLKGFPCIGLQGNPSVFLKRSKLSIGTVSATSNADSFLPKKIVFPTENPNYPGVLGRNSYWSPKRHRELDGGCCFWKPVCGYSDSLQKDYYRGLWIVEQKLNFCLSSSSYIFI